jgi:HAD superfamily hydrolase (TIGR01509 family)
MDGTLVETEPLWSQAIATVAADHGVAWDHHRDAPLLVGVLVPDLVELLRRRGVRATATELTRTLIDEVAERIGTRPPWRPGARELLAALARRGIPTALVTTSVRRHAVAVADAAPPGSLRVVVAAEDVQRHKPDPAAYLLAMDRLGVPAADAVALEDSVPGLRAALAAQLTVLAVRPETVLPADLAGAARLHRVADLGQARSVLGLDPGPAGPGRGVRSPSAAAGPRWSPR